MRLLGACIVALVGSLISVASRADDDDDLDFDEVFRNWGDADHMGVRGLWGMSSLRTLEADHHEALGLFVMLAGQGVAYSYPPSTPKSFRFAGFGSLGVAFGGETTSFDGAIGGEAMIGYRLMVPPGDEDRQWPRTELVGRVGFGFHAIGNHLLYSSALELPRLELGVRREGWYGGHWDDDWFRRHSFNFEIRGVATLVPTGRYALTVHHREIDWAPAWGGQIDLVGIRPEVSFSYLRIFSELEVPVDRFDAQGCLKLGPQTWSRHPYALCASWRLLYEIDPQGTIDAVSGQGALSFGFNG
ncbi:MAG: hypothetical protein JRI68_27060 [Deltaproteobacteria bacterium]|nr:hypothetical protein [Deltaproteobacteria bacterium]